jgi:hypothetical protein
MSFLQAICGKNRFDGVRNNWVMNECGVTENVFNKYETSVLKWFGHVERMGDDIIAKQVYMGRVYLQEKNEIGRVDIK